MASIEHERILADTIAVLRAHGYRVIRLDKNVYPDAVALQGDKTIAVEADAGRGTTNRDAFEGFDQTLIVQKPLNKRYHTVEEYKAALRMRKSGLTYDKIANELSLKFKRKFSRNIVHCWCKGKAKPLYSA